MRQPCLILFAPPTSTPHLLPKGSNMALSFLLVLAATVILIRPETPVTKALHHNSLECCSEKLKTNSSCSNDTRCEPGCFFRVLEGSNTVCILCEPAAVDSENITTCTYNYTMDRKNHTTVTTVMPKIAFIFQPSETAVMIPSSTARKQRYVRRERPSATSSGAIIPTASTTRVHNV
ncbi:uncharacterized protein C1orf159 homolog isoform X3 [Phyllopteryx taeniolatus]|uniref:uncharacterized protein C1orf159 homolog isoform X3 n=1 Tax=Phyllopteryx taeniolatus TaxID=161469 RepID=UPI002AD47C06|nr:uncharacterized protein C1orf159 homolog isoform X3 [Phyllopteryx taeniolatus]